MLWEVVTSVKHGIGPGGVGKCFREVKGRHDPCVLPRCPPLLEGMSAITIADLVLRQRSICRHLPMLAKCCFRNETVS